MLEQCVIYESGRCDCIFTDKTGLILEPCGNVLNYFDSRGNRVRKLARFITHDLESKHSLVRSLWEQHKIPISLPSVDSVLSYETESTTVIVEFKDKVLKIDLSTLLVYLEWNGNTQVFSACRCPGLVTIRTYLDISLESIKKDTVTTRLTKNMEQLTTALDYFSTSTTENEDEDYAWSPVLFDKIPNRHKVVTIVYGHVTLFYHLDLCTLIHQDFTLLINASKYYTVVLGNLNDFSIHDILDNFVSTEYTTCMKSAQENHQHYNISKGVLNEFRYTLISEKNRARLMASNPNIGYLRITSTNNINKIFFRGIDGSHFEGLDSEVSADFSGFDIIEKFAVLLQGEGIHECNYEESSHERNDSARLQNQLLSNRKMLDDLKSIIVG